jgi:hypothetical protein
LWVTRNDGAEGTSDGGQALLRVTKGKAKVIANLWDFEALNNPVPTTPQGAPDVRSNPFDAQALDGETALVIDSAGNDLLRIDSEGHIELLAIFPNRAASLLALKAALGCPVSGIVPHCFLPEPFGVQAVPTSVAVGPDGHYYVGELRGFPGPVNQSSIWRVSPNASGAVCNGADPDCELVYDGGFTSVIDLAFGPEGLLYIAELDENGWWAAEQPGLGAGGTINACDLADLQCVEVASGIPFLTAITFGKDGQLWATRQAVIPPLAQVFAVQ